MARASTPYVPAEGVFNRSGGHLTLFWRSRRGVLARIGAGLLVILSVLSGAASAQAQPRNPTDAAKELRLMVIGDSLAAGFGLPADESFPAQLQAALRRNGRTVTVLNAGVSGDTSAGGRARLDWALAGKPDAVIVELGANDGLRGIDPKTTYANLAAILTTLKSHGVPVFLTGMYAPPNLGVAYGEEFRAVYTRLAQEFDVPLYRFFLDGVAAQPRFNQADGMHPNAAGVAVVVKKILPQLEPWLARIDSR